MQTLSRASFNAYVFDAHGTLYDTQSMLARAEQSFPNHAEARSYGG